MKHHLQKSKIVTVALVAAITLSLVAPSVSLAAITQPMGWIKAYDQASGTATGASFAIAERVRIVF